MPTHRSSPTVQSAKRGGGAVTTTTIVLVAAAMAATLLGIVALGVAAFGVAWMRFVGLASIGAGGVLAGVVRWGFGSPVDECALSHLAAALAELEHGDPSAAAREATKAAAAAATTRTRNRALTALAWAALGQGYPERAKAALDMVNPQHAIDLQCLAAVEAARGHNEMAIKALDVVWSSRSLDREGAKLFVDCHLRAHGMESAVRAALQVRMTLGREDCEKVVRAARQAGTTAAAAALAAVLRNEAGATSRDLGDGTATVRPAATRQG
jgi:hypothetical protein